MYEHNKPIAQCIVFLADGKHISQVENCETAKEAIERAEAWCFLGHKAQAFLTIADLERGELRNYPLTWGG